MFSKTRISTFIGRWEGETLVREIKILWRNRQVRWLGLIAAGFNVVSWFTALFIYRQADEPVIALHHTIYFGINLIGAPYKVFALPLLGAGVIVANVLFASLIRREGEFFTGLLMAAAIIVNIFLLLGLGAIALVNFR
jgi:hypothetical protein